MLVFLTNLKYKEYEQKLPDLMVLQINFMNKNIYFYHGDFLLNSNEEI